MRWVKHNKEAPVFPFKSTTWTRLSFSWNITLPFNVGFLFQTQTCCEGLQQLGYFYPLLHLFSVFIFKNRWLKVVWGFSTVVRRCQICLLMSFVFIFPQKAAQINISHDTGALHFHWTKQTHRTADFFVFFCLFQETMKKNVDLFRCLAIFQIVLLFLKRFEASH